MNTPLTILKATGLSFIIFWAIIFSKEKFTLDMFPYVFLSLIPIGLCCLVVICLTICPFFWANNKSKNIDTVLKTYFPFYAIILFALCGYGFITSNLDTFSVAFISSAFFTLLKSWTWLAKSHKNKNE
ncbi:hypothetical protein DIS18_14045 [Algibacter marinivivus]|uniref:Uncharacterized protein n=1 Tax=Algibacter marinivivus TaxID=2100723 RepID=A0A2U2X1Y8_9FLAO|nr:hypothetical protein [Algibacter marinivivus]PWH81795.1 hypothetical protein DIS18_14045 [Algibacter marinivivus]